MKASSTVGPLATAVSDLQLMLVKQESVVKGFSWKILGFFVTITREQKY